MSRPPPRRQAGRELGKQPLRRAVASYGVGLTGASGETPGAFRFGRFGTLPTALVMASLSLYVLIQAQSSQAPAGPGSGLRASWCAGRTDMPPRSPFPTAHHPFRRPHRHAARPADRRHRHCRALCRPRGPAAACARHSVELRAHPAASAAAQIKVPRVLAVAIVVATAFGIIFALGWMMSREATDLAADLPNYRATLSEKIESFRESTQRIERAEKGGRRPVRPATAAQCADRRRAACARRSAPRPGRPTTSRSRSRSPSPSRPAGRSIRPSSRYAAAAARHRRHRAAVRHFHPAPARGSARPADPAVRRLRPAARHLHHDRRGHQAQPLFPEPGADQLRLWRADRRRLVADRRAESDRLGHPRRADALRALCRRLYRCGAPLADRRRHRSRLDHLPHGAGAVRGGRDDHGPGGRAAGVRPRHRRDADRR